MGPATLSLGRLAELRRAPEAGRAIFNFAPRLQKARVRDADVPLGRALIGSGYQWFSRRITDDESCLELKGET